MSVCTADRASVILPVAQFGIESTAGACFIGMGSARLRTRAALAVPDCALQPKRQLDGSVLHGSKPASTTRVGGSNVPFPWHERVRRSDVPVCGARSAPARPLRAIYRLTSASISPNPGSSPRLPAGRRPPAVDRYLLCGGGCSIHLARLLLAEPVRRGANRTFAVRHI